MIKISLEQCLNNAPTIWVALSGGADSVYVLLHLLESRGDARIQALHIDHGLQAASTRFTAFCRQLCEENEVPLTVVEVEISAAEIRRLGVEAAARDARYAALKTILSEGDALVTGHHADDQAETVILQLMRGAGPDGLSGMPVVRRLGCGFLVRPLLDMPQDAIIRALRARGQNWMDDPMNADPRFDRTLVRTQLAQWRDRRPNIVKALCRAAKHQQRAAEIQEKHAEQLMHRVDLGGDIDLREFHELTQAERTLVMRYWLKTRFSLVVSEAQLANFLRQLENHTIPTAKIVLCGQKFGRRRSRLYAH